MSQVTPRHCRLFRGNDEVVARQLPLPAMECGEYAVMVTAALTRSLTRSLASRTLATDDSKHMIGKTWFMSTGLAVEILVL